MSETRIPFHPYAELFPPMTPAEFYGLCADIASPIGLQEEIVLYEGKILDGRSRYLACLLKGVPPRFRQYAGECGSPLAFVVSKNIHRRHLTDGQRAWVAARLKPLFEEEAQLRQRAGLKQATAIPVGTNLAQRENPKETGRSADKAAQLMKVSQSSVKAADQVQKLGVPQLADALAAGKIAVSTAARIAKLPAEQQHAVVAAVETGVKPKQALAQVTTTAANDQTACVDDDGRPLPEGVIPAFRQRKELGKVCRRVRTLTRDVEQLAGSPIAVHLDVPCVLNSLDAARKALWAAQPARLCAHGSGEQSTCQACRGCGWLPAGMRSSARGGVMHEKVIKVESVACVNS
jgi:hypothetical protein